MQPGCATTEVLRSIALALLHEPSRFGEKAIIQELMVQSGGLNGKITTLLAQAAELAIRQKRPLSVFTKAAAPKFGYACSERKRPPM